MEEMRKGTVCHLEIVRKGGDYRGRSCTHSTDYSISYRRDRCAEIEDRYDIIIEGVQPGVYNPHQIGQLPGGTWCTARITTVSPIA